MLVTAALSLGVVGCGSSDGGDDSPIVIAPSEDWEAGDGWVLAWSDEFSESSIDSSIWTHETGYGSYGWGNDEWQSYTNSQENSSVEDGILSITAESSGTLGKRDGSITSARMITQDKIEFDYGKVAAKIMVPSGQGIWPAFWMLGANIDSAGWPACGEVDIMEKIGGTDKSEQTLHGTIHYSDSDSDYAYDGGSISFDEYLSDGYHVYEIEWSESAIIWRVDGYQFHSVNITNAKYDEFRNEFFIILNVAVGGNWPGDPDTSTVFPQQMLVDWVRVYTNE